MYPPTLPDAPTIQTHMAGSPPQTTTCRAEHAPASGASASAFLHITHPKKARAPIPTVWAAGRASSGELLGAVSRGWTGGRASGAYVLSALLESSHRASTPTLG